jgi:purine-binding chemotaxis protein CheW
MRSTPRTGELASCSVGGHRFGLEVAQVQEVTRGGNLTRLPLGPTAVCGLLNLRGHVVAVIDLRICLELGERPAGATPVHVILKTDGAAVSLLVDEVGEVLVVDEDNFVLPAGTMRGRARDLIRCVYKLDDGLLLALDTAKILGEMERTPQLGEFE